MRTRTCFAVAAAALLTAAGACSGERAELDAAAARGRKTWENVCIACHAPDPNLDGTLGPAVAGASLELLQAKVLRGEYPPGYAPRRPGAVMPKYPYVEERLADVAAYLAEVARPSAR
jgi:mono/diheme cytochrome c family protein